MNPGERFYTDSDVAQLCQVTPRVIADARRRGELGFVRLGRLPRVRQTDLDEYLARREVTVDRAS